ncbi:phosphoesterase [archaeon]|nr:phosphoesterase [archaeon]
MDNQYIMDRVKIVDLALYFERSDTLSIADLQLGYEEMMNSQGILVPRFNFSSIKKRLEKILKETTPKKIVLNGDLKQEFGRVSRQEWSEVLQLFELLKQHTKEIIVVKGNHDVFLGPITKWEHLDLVDQHYLEKEQVLFVHGHVLPETEQYNNTPTLVIGHEHPAVKIRDGAKTETFKCFLKGRYANKTLIIQPSFTDTHIGTNVLDGRFLSPFLEEGLEEFETWIVEDKPYYFGSVEKLREME